MINELLELTGAEWRFDPMAFGALRGATSDQAHRFALNYVSQQLSHEALGIVEKTDGMDGVIEEQVLKSAIVRAVVDVFRLAHLMGMTGDDLVHALQRAVAERPLPPE